MGYQMLNGIQYGGGSGGSSTLATLEDVSIGENVTEGQILSFDEVNKKWVNRENSGGSGGGIDVEANGNTLKFTGGGNSVEVKLANQGSSVNAIRFGIDADGNYGYYKVGADTVTPFKTGGSISGFPYRITTFTFYNQTFEVYQNDVLITTATFDENGSAVIVLPAEGEYILKCNGFEKTFNLVYNSKDFSTVPEYFFSTIKLNNPINRLHAVSAGYTTPTITETSAIVTGCSGNNYYYNKMNYIYFDKIPLDKISTIIMKVTRTNNNGRMYMGICNEDIEIFFKSNESKIPTTIGNITTTNWGKIKYPSDQSGTWSLDVSDITGEYYIFIGHCAYNCETSIQEWYWT